MSTFDERRQEMDRIMATVNPVVRKQLIDAYFKARYDEDVKHDKVSSIVFWVSLSLACVIIYLMVVRVVLN